MKRLMRRLLVSVRDVEEARQAIRGGATIIDVKEPHRGSLGAADPGQWLAISQVVRDQAPLSAALGELAEAEQIVRQRGSLRALQGYAYVKVGLADGNAVAPSPSESWRLRWSQLLQALPHGLRWVAVVYADFRRANAPPPAAIIDTAASLGCSHVLFDTFDKPAGSVFDALPLDQLRRLVCQVRQHEMQVVLAGSLRREHLPQVAGLLPDVIAVRGAVCRGTRCDAVDAVLVKQWVEHLADLAFFTPICE